MPELLGLFGMSNTMLLVQLGVFGGIACLIWICSEKLFGDKSRAEERLDVFRDPAKGKRNELGAQPSTSGAVAKMFENVSPALAKPLESKNEKEVGNLKARLSYAGFRNPSAPQVFLGIKTILLAFGLVVGGGLSVFQLGFTFSALMRVVIYGGLGFYIPEIGLWFLGSKRKESIFLGLPDALDLMVVCVEAGLGLDQAMRKVAEEMKKSYRVISEEFGLCNLQMQMGRTRKEVLQDLGARSGVDDLRALAAILIQADKFGSSIAQALRVQSEAMRTRRKQIAEEKAAKTAVQLIFPLVLFIFPGIFVVLVGPAAIQMIRQMFTMF
jgi:tight adherence protein C